MARIRLAREAPRYLLAALALAGIGASVRFLVDPPVARPAAPAAPAAALADRAAEGFAVLFARRYLTWDASEPQLSQTLAGYLGSGEGSAAFTPPATGAEHVAWAEVVQAREAAPGWHYYTVAAQTDSAGLVYLSVGVRREPGGTLALAGYPAFVGPPASEPAPPQTRLREVTDASLATVVQRALRNYLAGSEADLQADLSPQARVSPPTQTLALGPVLRLGWSADSRSVLAVVGARDGRGAQYTLGYELDVLRLQGRWEISAIQMDPAS
jgi:Conjugative transposon protein TcpC